MSNISPFLIRLFRLSFVGPKNPPSPRGKVRAFGAKESNKLKFELPLDKWKKCGILTLSIKHLLNRYIKGVKL